MKILYVTTISNTVNAFLIPHIKMLIDEGHHVDVAFNIEQEVKSEINEMGCKVHVLPFQRSPLKKDNILAYKMLKSIIISEEYALVHTHTPVASAIVRLACRELFDVRVFYTAHGFHFFNGAPILNWLLYYPIEKWLSRYTDTIITINNEDYIRAQRKLKANRVEYIPGVGIDVGKLTTLSIDKESIRNKLGLSIDDFVVLSVGELNKNKNHEVIIKAIANIDNKDIHYIICGQGKLHNYLIELSKGLGVENQVHLLGYRNDITDICKMSDVFAFPSYREGLSVALMEAMANGLPIICSNIRGNSDLVKEGKGGLLVKSNNILGFSNNLKKLMLDNKLRELMKNYNQKIILDYYITSVLPKMQNIYSLKVNK